MTLLLKKIFRLLAVAYVFIFAYLWAQPPHEELVRPERSFVVSDDRVHFLADETFVDATGLRVTKQEIWDTIFRTITHAEHFVFLDMFLFNDFQGTGTASSTRALSGELTETLLAKRASDPHVPIALVTDPINTVYGGAVAPHLEQLHKAGVVVIMTDLTVLRDSNLLWSALWRPAFAMWGNTADGGKFPHPFQYDGAGVPLRSWFSLLNFKANHRKLIVAAVPVDEKQPEKGAQVLTIVSSSNPHDGSSAHSNVALQVDAEVWKDTLDNETVIANLSNAGLPLFGNDLDSTEATGTLKVSLVRDAAIRKKALSFITGTKKGDTIDLEMFYLSERSIVRALADASSRGVQIRVILDPNKDAFGHKKNGIPNRPVAKELTSRSDGEISIRWCDTHGEQCHAKLLMGKTASSTFLLVGSANFTRRNIGGYNLEADLAVESPSAFTAWTDAQAHFNRLWKNEGGSYTTDYEVYRDETLWKAPLYRLMESSGLSSF